MDHKKISFLKKFTKVSAFDVNEIELAKKDEKVKYKLFEENKPLFYSIMKRYSIDSDEMEDYLQEFWIVYNNAIDNFQSNKGSFSTYLSRAIELFIKTKYRNTHTQKADESTTQSINDPINETQTIADTIGVDESNAQDVKLMIDQVEKKIKDPKIKKILDLLKMELPLREIADEVGVSYQTVSNIIDERIKPLFGEELSDVHLAMETWKRDGSGQYRVAEIVVDTYSNIVAHNENAWLLKDYNDHDTIKYKFVSQKEGLLDMAISQKVASLERTMLGGEMIKIRRGEQVKNAQEDNTLSGELKTFIQNTFGLTVESFEVENSVVFKFIVKEEIDAKLGGEIVESIKQKFTIRVLDCAAISHYIAVLVAAHSCYYCSHFVTRERDGHVSCNIWKAVSELYDTESVNKWLTNAMNDNQCNFWLNAIK